MIMRRTYICILRRLSLIVQRLAMNFATFSTGTGSATAVARSEKVRDAEITRLCCVSGAVSPSYSLLIEAYELRLSNSLIKSYGCPTH